MKKLFSFVLSLVMVFSITVPAFAVDETATVFITLLIPVQLVRMELWPNQRHRSLLLILPTRKTKRSQISKTRIISEMSTTAVPLNSHIQLWKEAIRV